MLNTLKNYKNFIMTYHFHQKDRNLEIQKSLQLIYMIKLNFIHIINLKQKLNLAVILKKIHRVIKFNKKDCLKPYIEMNTELRQKAKNNFEFF